VDPLQRDRQMVVEVRVEGSGCNRLPILGDGLIDSVVHHELVRTKLWIEDFDLRPRALLIHPTLKLIETSLCLELRLQSVAYALKILLFLGAAAGYFDQMVSERSLDGIAHAADLEAERGVHKLCDKGRLPIDPSQGAAFLAAAAVIRVLLGE